MGEQNKLRELIMGVNTKVPLIDGQKVTCINFDNAATTPPLKSVMYRINKFVPWYSSIHRGTGYKSRYSSKRYEAARQKIGGFVGADMEKDTIIFVKNTTEALNKLSYRLIDKEKKQVILSSMMEHHSNDLPWRDNYAIDYISIDEKGLLSLDDMEKKLIKYKGKVKLVTITGASNVTGHINDIHQIAKIAHQYNAKLLVDGAQLVPHCPVNMKAHDSDEHIDFLVFSAHKMYAPFGIGVLIGPKEFFQYGSPEYKGGGTVKIVTENIVLWDDPPYKDEAGSPNIIGVIALESAIETLSMIGLETIDRYEKNLTKYALKKLNAFDDIQIYGDTTHVENKVGIITFNMDDMPHDILATILSYEAGIAVRNGCFCAQPYVQKLLYITPEQIQHHIKHPDTPHPGMVRISFGFYNTIDEIDDLIFCLEDVSMNKKYYIDKYKDIILDTRVRMFNPLYDDE